MISTHAARRSTNVTGETSAQKLGAESIVPCSERSRVQKPEPSVKCFRLRQGETFAGENAMTAESSSGATTAT